jgi:PST family polysaccharide transporter
LSIATLVKGTAFIGFVSVLRLLVQFVSVPVLARLLSPVDYGLAAMAMPVILFVMLIADAGLGNSLVRTSRTNDQVWHTCFWLSVGLGIVGAAGVASLSPVVAFLLNEARLTPLLAALAAIIPLQTFTLVPGASLQKEARFGTIAATQIVAMCASLGTAVALAIAGVGVWALIWQQIVFYAVRLTLTLTCSSYRPCLVFDLHDAWEHVIFGRNMLGVSLISSASRSLENLVIGKVHGAGPVGVYIMAFQFARLPFMLVTGPIQYVLYPHVAAIREDRAQTTALFVLLTRILAMVLLPAVALVAVASEPTFTLLLSTKWRQAAPIFALIAPAAALQPVTAIVGTFLMALGRTDVQMRLAAQFAAVWIVGLMISVWYGIAAVATTYSICALLFSAWSLRMCLPLVNCSFATYARLLMWPMALTVWAMLAYRVLSSPGVDHNVLNVGIAITLALLVTLGAFLAQRRPLITALTTSGSSTQNVV